MQITLGQQYNVGEKPAVILYIYINRHVCCCCCLHIKSRSDLYSVLSNIRTGPTDADAFLPWSQANYPERVHIVKKY